MDPSEVLKLLADMAGIDIEEVSGRAAPPLRADDIPGQLAEIGELVRGDRFQIFAEVAERTATFTDAARLIVLREMLNSPSAAIRDAGTGWLLDGAAKVRAAALDSLLAAGSELSSSVRQWLVIIRGWLPEAEQRALAPLCPVGATGPAAYQFSVMASAVDGTGSQSFFGLIKTGRRYAVVSVLIKLEVGVADAWVQRDLTKQMAEGMLSSVAESVDLLESTPDYLLVVLRNALAVGKAAGVMPPFGLVDGLETLGLGPLTGVRLTLEDLIAGLLADIPATRRRSASVAKALRRSGKWDRDFSCVESWFEHNPDVSDLMEEVELEIEEAYDERDEAEDDTTYVDGSAMRVAALFEDYLPERRLYWAEIIARMAAVLRAEGQDDDWHDFARVAAELAGTRPLAEIPLMTVIARQTCDAWEYESAHRKMRGL